MRSRIKDHISDTVLLLRSVPSPIVTLFVPAFVVWYMSRTCVKRFRKFDGSLEEEQEEAVGEKPPQDDLQTIQLN